MASLSPELWHIVASFLSIRNATKLRLVNKFLADIAGAHIIPHVSFHMHQNEVARLGEISNHSVLAPNVRSLTYFATLCKTPAVTFDEFKNAHEEWVRRTATFPAHLSHITCELADDSTLLSEYGKYQHMVAVQNQMGVDMADFACLKDAIAKFTGLKHVTMSHGFHFLRRTWDRDSTPFNTPFKMPVMWPQPEGVRQLEVLLEALAHNKVRLDSLRAGILRWEFFDKTRTELERLFQPTLDASQVELNITLDLDDDLNDLTGDTEKCRQFMERGTLRELLSRMKRLKWLGVGFEYDLNVPEAKPAMLKDIASPSHHWPQLQRLQLWGIETDRHALMQLLRLHKDTLRFLHLQDISLGETSWSKLLPEIRNNLYLEDACICGFLTGRTEDMPDKGSLESWCLSDPEDGDDDDMRESINCYCREGGWGYPDELPLTDEIVRKNFDEYVSLIPRGDSEGSEGSEDSEDSEPGSNSYDSDEEDSEGDDDESASVEDLSEGDGSDGGVL